MYSTKTTKKLSVLLVDDDSDYRWLIRDAMHMTGISCSFTENKRAYEALAVLRSSKKTLPDMILVDIEMPGMNGIEFLEELKKMPTLRDIITIVVSGVKMQKEDCDEILQKGAAGVVHKTPDIYEMTRLLLEAIDNAA
jgi:CheY-like chemotaxis protein